MRVDGHTLFKEAHRLGWTQTVIPFAVKSTSVEGTFACLRSTIDSHLEPFRERKADSTRLVTASDTRHMVVVCSYKFLPSSPRTLVSDILRRQVSAQSTSIRRVALAPGTIWTPLGPAPLASGATGLGVQDFGPVSGRATAVAIDPPDGTGNTACIGGAYG